ncbi:POU domain, class 5, transcription factor 1.1-like [Discoglossus pictus]
MHNQAAYQPYPVISRPNQDGSHSFNMNNFLGYLHQQPQMYHTTGMRPHYGEFDAQAGTESSEQVKPWNGMPAYDQTGAHGSGLVSSPKTVNYTNIKQEKDSDQEETTETKYTPPQYAMDGLSYNTTGNPNFWPGIPMNAMPSNYSPSSQQLPIHWAIQGANIYTTTINKSPEIPREDEKATMEGSHCTTNSPPCNGNSPIDNQVVKDDDLSSEHEEVDPEVEREIKEFAKELRQKRVQLGHTQGDIGSILGSKYGKFLSQTTICRFESLQLSYKNMRQLKPVFELWFAHAETTDDLQDLLKKEPAVDLPQTRKRKRRSNIDPADKMALENYFTRCRKPGAQEMAQLARDLNMEKDVVLVWFCNRRQKGKRQGNMAFSDENAGEASDAQVLPQANGGAYDVLQIGQSQGYAAQPMAAFPVYSMGYHANEMYNKAMPMGNHSI